MGLKRDRTEYREKNREKNKQYYKKYYIENRETILIKSKIYGEKNKEKIAKQKKEYHQKTKEYHSNFMKDYYIKHKETISIMGKKHYQENREKILGQHKKYLRTANGIAADQRGKANKRTIKKNIVNTLTSQEWLDILEEYNYHCAYCGVEFNCELLPEKEHTIPISKGGDNTKENVVPACRSCNAKKHNKILALGRRINGVNQI